jgi:hypothetical protein
MAERRGAKRTKPSVAASLPDKRFWDIIAVGCPHDAVPDEWLDTLCPELAKLDLDELAFFDNRFDELTDAAYRRDLWSVAALINCGASDDGFYYFRCWLVGMGKLVYEAALANPDSLADVCVPEEDYEAEIYGAIRIAWCNYRGGSEEELDRAFERLRRRRRVKLTGKELDFHDAKVRKRFPRLTALYLEEGPEEGEKE